MPEVLNLIGNDERPTVCETQVAGDIWRTIELTQKLGCIGSVVGEPGVGKTTAARAYAERERRARYCVMDPVHDTMNAMLSLVCNAICRWSSPCRNRDHTTVLSACKRLDARIEADTGLKAEIDALSAAIAASAYASAAGDSRVRDAALALRSEARALEDRAARLDALAKGLMATAEIGGKPSRQAPR